MTTLPENLHSLPDVDFPAGLHGAIMRRLFFLRFRTPAIAITALLVANLFISGWHLWIKLSEEEGLEIMRAIFEDAELSVAFSRTLWQTTWEIVPIHTLAIFCINVFIIGYLVRMFVLFRREVAAPIVT